MFKLSEIRKMFQSSVPKQRNLPVTERQIRELKDYFSDLETRSRYGSANVAYVTDGVKQIAPELRELDKGRDISFLTLGLEVVLEHSIIETARTLSKMRNGTDSVYSHQDGYLLTLDNLGIAKARNRSQLAHGSVGFSLMGTDNPGKYDAAKAFAAIADPEKYSQIMTKPVRHFLASVSADGVLLVVTYAVVKEPNWTNRPNEPKEERHSFYVRPDSSKSKLGDHVTVKSVGDFAMRLARNQGEKVRQSPDHRYENLNPIANIVAPVIELNRRCNELYTAQHEKNPA